MRYQMRVHKRLGLPARKITPMNIPEKVERSGTEITCHLLGKHELHPVIERPGKGVPHRDVCKVEHNVAAKEIVVPAQETSRRANVQPTMQWLHLLSNWAVAREPKQKLPRRGRRKGKGAGEHVTHSDRRKLVCFGKVQGFARGHLCPTTIQVPLCAHSCVVRSCLCVRARACSVSVVCVVWGHL